MELILHATSTGPLRSALDEYWFKLPSDRVTSAQQWLPHATIAKTIRTLSDVKADLDDHQVSEAKLMLEKILGKYPHEERLQPSIDPLTNVHGASQFSFRCRQWLEIGNDFRREVQRAFQMDCEVETKQHISVAWGTGFNAAFHNSLAIETLTSIPRDEDSWSIGLWSKLNGAWESQSLIPW